MVGALFNFMHNKGQPILVKQVMELYGISAREAILFLANQAYMALHYGIESGILPRPGRRDYHSYDIIVRSDGAGQFSCELEGPEWMQQTVEQAERGGS